MAAPTGVDPITLEVMRNALYSIADEMTGGLVRAAYSTNIKDRRDCSCAVYTLAGEVVAMSEWGGTPLLTTFYVSPWEIAAEVPSADTSLPAAVTVSNGASGTSGGFGAGASPPAASAICARRSTNGQQIVGLLPRGHAQT